MEEAGEELKIRNFKNRTTILGSVDRKPINKGGGEKKDQIKAKVKNPRYGKERSISLIIKKIRMLRRNEEELKMHASDVWLGKWKTLKKAGIPVVETVRRVSDTEVAMTDLTASGDTIFGRHRNKEAKEANEFLMKIDGEDIKKRALEVAQLADDAGILLADDDALALVVHKDGSWNVIALDIGNTEFKKDSPYDIHFLENFNKYAASDLVEDISMTRSFISTG